VPPSPVASPGSAPFLAFYTLIYLFFLDNTYREGEIGGGNRDGPGTNEKPDGQGMKTPKAGGNRGVRVSA
jgi:hypothetical protein